MHKIVSIRLDELHDRVRAKKMALFVDDATKQYLAVKGYSAEYGARPLNRVIQKEVSQPMSRSILENQFEDGETIRVVMNPADGRVSGLVVIRIPDSHLYLCSPWSRQTPDAEGHLPSENAF